MNMEVVKEILKVIGIIVLIYLFKAVHNIIYIAYFGPLSKLPGPKLFFLSRLFISFQQFTGKRWEFIQFKIIPKYGRIVRLGPELVLIADKDLIKDMVVTSEFPKSRNYLRIRADSSSETLFSTIDKKFHKQRRRTLSPAFSIKYMSSLEPLMETCIKDLIIKDIIGETSFGGKFDGIKTVNHPLPGKVWLELRRRILRSMLPLLKPFFRMDPYLKEFSDSLIKKRMKEKPKKDILQFIVDAANDENNENKMTDFEIFDQIFEFLYDDTVSFTTSMAIILLARHPEKLNKLYNEIKASNKSKDIDDGYYDGENGALLKHEQLKGLPYLNAVIHETMRLWPVVLDGGIGRAPTEDIIVKGYLIPKDTNLMINYYTLHHDPEYWGADVENFIPERWFDIDKLPKDSFYPFSAGARNCIGQNFAMMEMRLIIGSLIYKYDIENLPNQNIDIVHYFTPMPRDQCYQLKFRKRQQTQRVNE
nr:7798_t:CDS:10 [Entrophospora candida]